jgi:hypothetical protein
MPSTRRLRLHQYRSQGGSSRIRPPAAGASTAVALPLAFFGRLVAGGFLTLSKRGSSTRVYEFKVAFAGDHPDRAIRVMNLELRPGVSESRLDLRPPTWAAILFEVTTFTAAMFESDSGALKLNQPIG